MEDAPKPANITIDDVTEVQGLIPKNIDINDSFVLSSQYGYEVRYRAVSPEKPVELITEISDERVALEGEVIKEGYGDDLILLNYDDLVGSIPIERHYSFGWGDEFISVNMTKK